MKHLVSMEDYSLSQRVDIKSTTAPEPFLELEDETIPFGERQITQYPKDGIESEGYLIKYINGVRVNNYKIEEWMTKGKILSLNGLNYFNLVICMLKQY